MKFVVSRTSVYDDDVCPCEGAQQEACISTDWRTVDDPTKIPRSRNESTDWWYERGRNHRVENGRIGRDFDDQQWFIEIASLDDLLEFQGKHGALVLQTASFPTGMREIEIYDDYRE